MGLFSLTPLFSQETSQSPSVTVEPVAEVATKTAKEVGQCLATGLEKSLTEEIPQCLSSKLAQNGGSLFEKSTNKELSSCFSEKTPACLAKTPGTLAMQSCLKETVVACFSEKPKSSLLKKLEKMTEKCVSSKIEVIFAEKVKFCSTSVAQAVLPISTTPPVPNPQTLFESYPPDIKRILERGEIIVAMLDTDSPPFFFHKESGEERYGLDIELAHGVAEKLGVKLKFNRTAKTFNEVVDIIVRGEADVAISKLSRTLERAKKVLFSEPYIIFHHGLLINRLRMAQISHGQNSKAFVQNLEGKIGVIAASSYVGYAKQKFPHAEIVEYKNWQPDIIDAVLNGDILAAYRDELEIKKAAYGNPEAALKVQTAVLIDTEDAIAMAVNWRDTHLLYWINEYIHSLNLQLTADKLLRKYPEVLKNQ
ncbi:MAG: hypothetical protein BWK79_15225 [Beggiatoa sp. IS2]|nr:MAG: hypothetical protein BWK79_15225 [Beggiatoa sp. IS2]